MRQLENEIVEEAFEDFEHACERVDSAEQAGLFPKAHANCVRALLYENTGQHCMAAYCAEKAIHGQNGLTPVTSIDSSDFYVTRWVLSVCAYYEGDYGKSIQLSKEVLATATDTHNPTERQVRGNALVQMAECEEKLNHIDEAERLYLECLDMQRVCISEATDPWELEPLMYTLLAMGDLYLDYGMQRKAMALIPLVDTVLNRLKGFNDEGKYVVRMRRNNLTISKAMVYAANGYRAEAERLFQEHRQAEGLQDADIDAEGYCMSLLGHYNDAVSLYDEADSLLLASGEPLNISHVEGRLRRKYQALQKAGRTAEALALGDRIRQLTDSLRREERQADVAQLEEIKRQEEEIAMKCHSLAVHRLLLLGAVLLLALSGYALWRFHRYNRQLSEKNRILYEQIQQREQTEAEERQRLQSQPAETLDAHRQIYQRLCRLMQNPDLFTTPETNYETLARLLNTNHTYLYAALRQCAGMTPAEFVNSYRIRYAAHLLTSTDDPVGLVSEQCGITNRSTFNRLFRDHYSMSPTEYRKSARQ